MERIILHVDVNNAFLSWSAVDRLNKGYKNDIRKECAVIGGNEEERRGIVLAKSELAKKFGITTAESLYSARRKYRNLKVYPPNHEIYKKYSKMLYEYLSLYSPTIEQYSIDECFIDYTGCEKLFGKVEDVAYKIKDEIKNNFGFTVNVGIGNNKLCAKMASDFSKPDKVHTLYNYEIKEKMWPLDIRELFMIGKKTSEKLKELNINKIEDLAKADITLLKKYFKNMACMMKEYANGIDESLLETSWNPKNISSGTVLPEDLINIDDINKVIRKLSLDVGKRLRKYNYYAFVIAVTIKYSNFDKISKQRKLEKGINTDFELYNESKKLFKELWNKKAIRHITIGCKDFSLNNSMQLSFENSDNLKDEKELQKVVDKIRNKYGSDIMIYGDMLEK